MTTNFNKWFVDFVDSCDGISVYFVDKTNKIFNSDINSKLLADFRTSFCKDLRLKYTENDNFSLPKLSNYDERKNALYKYDFELKEMPLQFKLTSDVLNLKATDQVPLYQVKNDKLDNIDAVIVLLTSSSKNKSVAFFQHVFPVSLLGPDKGVLNITTHKTRIVELEQDVLKLTTKFVFMQLGKHYLVENVNALESQLHFKKVIRTRAEKYSGEIETLGLVEDMTKFNDRISKEDSFARKLVKAYKNSAVIKEKISNEKIVNFATNNDYYSQYLKPSESGLSFKLDSIIKCKKFLELLDDDFLKSELTNRNYLARSKDLL
ncbi:anti-phage protein KwaB [Photobacterium sp. DNB22_13_2]